MPTPGLDLRALARLGASMRLAELDRERAAILAAFPNFRRGNARSAEPRRRKRKMSAAGRAAISAAAKRMWAERRKTQK